MNDNRGLALAYRRFLTTSYLIAKLVSARTQNKILSCFYGVQNKWAHRSTIFNLFYPKKTKYKQADKQWTDKLTDRRAEVGLTDGPTERQPSGRTPGRSTSGHVARQQLLGRRVDKCVDRRVDMLAE